VDFMREMSLLRVAPVVGVLALAGCSSNDMERSFGLTQAPPDEFTVTTHAPLEVPPDLSLRPPDPGAPRPQELTPTRAAEATLVPQSALQPDSPAPEPVSQMSPGEQALLASAGPAPPPGIRIAVDQEAAKEASSHALTDELMFWKTPKPPGTVVDAEKEAQRLRTNAALGESVDHGDTPIIEKKPRNIIDWLF
jgi:hypothetical protein